MQQSNGSEPNKSLRLWGKCCCTSPLWLPHWVGRGLQGPPHSQTRRPRVSASRWNLVTATTLGSKARVLFCQRCLTTAYSQQAAARREQFEACRGEHPGLKRLAEGAQQLEHKLLLCVWQGKPTLICRRCGAMASTDKHSGLREPCQGQPANGRAGDGVARAERGYHPHQRQRGKLEALYRVSGESLEPL